MTRRLLLAIAMALMVAPAAYAQPWTPSPAPGAPPAGANRFHGPLDAAVELAAREQRPLLVYFTGPGCPACVVMGRTVLSRTDVRDAAAPFIEVVVDVTTPAGTSAARAFDVERPPALVVLRPDGTELRSARMEGPQRGRDVVWHLRAAVNDPTLVPPEPDSEPAPLALRSEPQGLSLLLLAVVLIAALSLFLATRRRRAR